MTCLIIGHVDHNHARIWVRGGQREPFAYLNIRMHGAPWRRALIMNLEERHFFTGVFEVDGLDPDTSFHCRVRFGNAPKLDESQLTVPEDGEGSFTTKPVPGHHKPFSFLLFSCNLHSLGSVSKPGPAFARIQELVEERDPAFVMYCGDQIYADIPRDPFPDDGHFRRKYLDAWDDCREMRRLLTRLPHYMILDDHEIFNDFANDVAHEQCDAVRDVAIKVYREFQHIHNPQTYGSEFLHYAFQHGQAHFFVMDTRSERYLASGPQMIDREQMDHFKQWLVGVGPNAYKFVVSSVPFVMDVVRSEDKWCGASYVRQRNEVIDFIAQNQLHQVVFLTGDMHCSYQAHMNVTSPAGDLVIHELMSSPVNQLGKSKISKFEEDNPHTTPGGVSYQSRFDQFYSGHSNVMLVQVDQTVRYEIYRTKKRRAAECVGRI